MGVLIRGCTAAALLALVAAPASAQTTASQSTTGTTKIVQAITLTKTTDLAFGTVVKPATGANSVVIDPTTGNRTLTGAGTAALTTSTTSRAAFSVGGEGAQTFSITVPATFNMTSGGNTLVVTLTTSAATGTLSGALGAAGTATFGVGGSFPIATTTVSGNYTGTFTTTVTYN